MEGLKDGVECTCGARTAVGTVGKPAHLTLFVGGSYKNGVAKFSIGNLNEAKQRCLWCGVAWPENLQQALKVGVP